MASWVYDPHSGGMKIPVRVKEPIKQRILTYAAEHYAGKYNRIDVHFRGKFCYIDAYLEPEVPAENFNEEFYGCTREERIEFLRTVPTHLCRLRYSGDTEKWAMAFYTYSNNKYEPCVFNNGTFKGTPEEAFESSAMYLQ
ncbi:hypothetical protein [Acaryochloris sp. IP29b_bin.148]|uniref:hypothetical protein n=1 Tax=Acaryochloris sp. IP29b_bin.148 TaxID=2969218 RepID=UPI0026226226|nr:hypothetical protein [Acaryochloris sp. IP29b_bin.148]